MLQNARRIVVKVGTSTLTYANSKPNLRQLDELARVLSDLANQGRQVVLVSSGAIAVGVDKLGLAEHPADTPRRQAAATVGQCELMFIYDKLFGEYGHVVGQLLITKADVEDPERRQNMVNAFEKLLDYGAIPIVNENDSVAVEEIVFGDNDSLSAIVAELTGADALVILTDADGLFDADPADCESAKLFSDVYEITPELEAIAGGAGSTRGTGGMITKLHAAGIATAAGIDTFVINGSPAQNIYKLLEGEKIGTHFHRRQV